MRWRRIRDLDNAVAAVGRAEGEEIGKWRGRLKVMKTIGKAIAKLMFLRGVLKRYLHYAYDLWVHRWRRTTAPGDVIVIRYADDTIVGFQHEHEARAFLEDLKERLRLFDLTLHPAKTMREICLDDGKTGQMACQRPPDHQIDPVVSPKRMISSSRGSFCVPSDAI